QIRFRRIDQIAGIRITSTGIPLLLRSVWLGKELTFLLWSNVMAVTSYQVKRFYGLSEQVECSGSVDLLWMPNWNKKNSSL
ncbi:MAG: hypothetical protein VX506_07655, partial [Pseudomonadota bacterium]|nr:hypothetical protein [Pseudomonadota bacterium]